MSLVGVCAVWPLRILAHASSSAALSHGEQLDAIREVQLLASLESPWVVRYLDSFLEDAALHLVMEFCPGGDLHGFIARGSAAATAALASGAASEQRASVQPLPDAAVWKAFIEICLGLEVLHARRILHRDLKPMNVLLDAQMRCKLADLGVARLLDTAGEARTLVGTPLYLSPEVCQGRVYGEPADVWALGCVLYELCVARRPFEAQNPAALILRIVGDAPRPLPRSVAPELRRLALSCLAKQAARRPSVVELLTDPAVVARALDLGLFGSFPPRAKAAVQRALMPPRALARARPTSAAAHARKQPSARQSVRPPQPSPLPPARPASSQSGRVTVHASLDDVADAAASEPLVAVAHMVLEADQGDYESEPPESSDCDSPHAAVQWRVSDEEPPTPRKLSVHDLEALQLETLTLRADAESQ